MAAVLGPQGALAAKGALCESVFAFNPQSSLTAIQHLNAPKKLEPRLRRIDQIPVSKERLDYFKERLSPEERATVFLNLIDNPEMALGKFARHLGEIHGLIIPKDAEFDKHFRFMNDSRIEAFSFFDLFSQTVAYADGVKIDGRFEQSWHSVFGDLVFKVMELSAQDKATKKVRLRTEIAVRKPYKSLSSPVTTREVLIEFATEKGLYEKEVEASEISDSEVGSDFDYRLVAANDSPLPDLRHWSSFFTWVKARPERTEYAKFLIALSAEVIVRDLAFKREASAVRNVDDLLAQGKFGELAESSTVGAWKKMVSVVQRKKDKTLLLRNTKLDIGYASAALTTERTRSARATPAFVYLALGEDIVRDQALLLEKTKTYFQTEQEYFGSLMDLRKLGTSILGDLNDVSSRISTYEQQIESQLNQILLTPVGSSRETLQGSLISLNKIQAEIEKMESDQNYIEVLAANAQQRIRLVQSELLRLGKNSGLLESSSELTEFNDFVVHYERSRDEKFKLMKQQIGFFKQQLKTAHLRLMKSL